MTAAPPPGRGGLRTLSSARTEQVKVVGLVLASLAAIATMVVLLMRQALPALVLLAVSIVLWLRAWVGLRLRKVETDGQSLLVSGQSLTARIPLREVIAVSRVWFPGAQRIYLEVGADTPFGREIVFEPRFDLGALAGRHPVVEELRALVARAKEAGPR